MTGRRGLWPATPAELAYWDRFCPACGSSPCAGGRRGACVEQERPGRRVAGLNTPVGVGAG